MKRKGQKAVQSKPNVVFILADDLGWGDLNCYGQTNFHRGLAFHTVLFGNDGQRTVPILTSSIQTVPGVATREMSMKEVSVCPS